MLNATDNALKITICGSFNELKALKAAGIRNVSVIETVESLYVQDEIDPGFSKYTDIVLAYPTAQAELRDAVAMRLDDARCSWVEWSDDFDGPIAALEAIGADRLGDWVRGESKPMWLDEVCRLSDIPAEPAQTAYETGFKLLDEHGFRLVRPAFMPVIGPYGSGKSVLLRQLAYNVYKLHGWRTLITAFEEKVRPRYERDFRRLFIEGDNDVRYGHSTPEDRFTPEMIAEADAEIDKAFRFLRRRRGDTMTVEKLIDRITFAVRTYGVECVIIDPVNEIDHLVPRGMSKTDYMAEFIMSLKQMADDYKLLVIAAAHPPKDGVARRGKAIYTLNDGADTAHYGNKADIGWCVWRPGMEGATYLNIDKCKDTEIMGVPTFAKLSFDPGRGNFTVVRTGFDVLEELIGGKDE